MNARDPLAIFWGVCVTTGYLHILVVWMPAIWWIPNLNHQYRTINWNSIKYTLENQHGPSKSRNWTGNHLPNPHVWVPRHTMGAHNHNLGFKLFKGHDNSLIVHGFGVPKGMVYWHHIAIHVSIQQTSGTIPRCMMTWLHAWRPDFFSPLKPSHRNGNQADYTSKMGNFQKFIHRRFIEARIIMIISNLVDNQHCNVYFVQVFRLHTQPCHL